MNKKTHAEHVAEIAAKNPNVEIIGKITGYDDKVLTRCLICGHEWETKPKNLKSRRGCPECAKVRKANALKLTHAEQIAAIAEKNPNVEVLGEITRDNKKVLCRCKICHHEWEARPASLKQKQGCPECKKTKVANALKLTHAEHVAAIYKANPNVEVLEEIKGANEKVLCRCKLCGHEWHGRPADLKDGHGCPKCARNIKLSHREQVEAIAKVNPNIEVLGEITSDHDKVLCRCKICGHEWNARPARLKNTKLKNRRGCPRCAKHGFYSYDSGKLYIMVDDLNVPTMMKIGVSVDEDERSKQVLKSARRAGAFIPALHVAKTREGPTELMIRIEQMMHENYEEWNIKFPTKFDGYKEFFYYNLDTAAAFDVIEETIHEIINGNQAA